jgi:hypothetical protein
MWMTFAQHQAICSPARLGRTDAVSPRKIAKLYTLAYGVCPCIPIIQIQSISDIDPLLLTTTTVLYEENNLQTGIALEKTLTPPMKQWKKDSKESKTVPQTIHDHDLRNPLLSIFESSMHGYPVCEAR